MQLILPIHVATPLALRVCAGCLAIFAGLLLAAASAGAQVRQTIPPVQQRLELEKKVLQQLLPDLVITGVVVKDLTPVPATNALVTVENKGTAAATFPAGSTLVRAEAPQSGGTTFQPMTTPTDYTVGAGQARTFTLSLDPCKFGKPSKVSFSVDPDNKVRELNETNNMFVIASVAPFATGDLQVHGEAVKLHSTAPRYGIDKDPANVPAGYPASLEVTIFNAGSGPALLCAGAAFFRETQSPVSSKYGLRTVPVGVNSKLLLPGNTIIVTLSNAYAAGDLPPGSYTWSVLVNPDGQMPEASAANNAASTVVKIQ